MCSRCFSSVPFISCALSSETCDFVEVKLCTTLFSRDLPRASNANAAFSFFVLTHLTSRCCLFVLLRADRRECKPREQRRRRNCRLRSANRGRRVERRNHRHSARSSVALLICCVLRMRVLFPRQDACRAERHAHKSRCAVSLFDCFHVARSEAVVVRCACDRRRHCITASTLRVCIERPVCSVYRRALACCCAVLRLRSS